MTLVRTDSLGNVVWSKSLGTSTVTADFDNILYSHVLSSGYSPYYNSDSTYVVKSDLSGNNDCHENPISMNAIPLSFADSIISLPNNPITMQSYTISVQESAQSVNYWRCSNISVPEVQSATPTFIISPNPYDNNLTLEIPDELNKPALVIMANANGIEVQRQQLDFNAQNKYVLNTLNLPSGIYVLILFDHSGNLLHRQKVVKL